MLAKAQLAAEERVLDALVGPTASPMTRDSFRKKLREGQLDDKEIDIEVQPARLRPADVRNPRPARRLDRAINLQDIFGKAMGGRTNPAAPA